MLNLIIRLWAIAKIITNETARALNLLAKQSTKCHLSEPPGLRVFVGF
jgi:hypothetical protein